MSDMIVRNSDGDFLQVQNYVLQLVAEKRLTQSAFILYSFYRSIAGFTEIRCGYKFISLNSGISKGSITSGNKLLEKEGLIRIIHRGRNNPFEIVITPGVTLPRRTFIIPEYEESSINEHTVQPMNSDDEKCSIDELINKDTNKNRVYKNNTTGARARKTKAKWTEDHNKLKDEFLKYYLDYYKKEAYHKQDIDKLLLIKDPLQAIKYIRVLWSLDEADKWIRNSDHSASIFVKEYISGRLEAYYPNTKHYYLDRQNA